MSRKTVTRAFVLLYLGVLVGCIVFRVEYWPFSDYRVYQQRGHHKDLVVSRFGGITPSGQIVFLPRHEVAGTTPTAFNQKGMDAKGDALYMQEVLRELGRQNRANPAFREFTAIAVVERRVKLDAAGAFEAMDRPLVTLPFPEP